MLVACLFLLIPNLVLGVEHKIGFLVSSQGEYKTSLEDIMNFAAAEHNQQGGDTLVIEVEEYNENSLTGLISSTCNLVEKNVVAVVSAEKSSHIAIMADILGPLHIPLMALKSSDPYLMTVERPFLLALSPSSEYQNMAIFALMKYNWWIYGVKLLLPDNQFGINGFIYLQQFMAKDNSTGPSNLVSVRFDGEVAAADLDPTEQLEVIQRSLSRVIILHCHGPYANVILKQAYDMGLMEREFVWILVDEVTSSEEDLVYEGVYPEYYEGMMGISRAIEQSSRYTTFKNTYLTNNPSTPSSHLTKYHVPLSYDAVRIIGDAISSLETPLNQQAVDCYGTSQWSSGQDLLGQLKAVDYSGLTGDISFDDAGESTDIRYDIVNFRNGAFQTVGTWTNSSDLELTGAQDIVYFQGSTDVPVGWAKSLSGMKLKIGVIHSPPFAIKSEDPNCSGNGCWTGYCIDMVTKLADDISFTYEFIEGPEGRVGSQINETMEWDGLIGELINSRIDLIAMSLSVSSLRSTYVYFAFPFMSSAISAVVQGDSSQQNPFFFLNPFHWSTWIAIISSIFIVTLLLNLFNKISPYGIYGKKIHSMQVCTCAVCVKRREKVRKLMVSYRQVNKYDCLVDEADDVDGFGSLSLYNSLWVVGSGLVSQSGDTQPTSVSGRFMLFSWWFFVMLMISMYTANLTSFLTLSNLKVNIQTIKDLVYQDTYTWGVIGDTFVYELLSNHVDADYKDVIKKGAVMVNMSESIARVKKGNFVFINEKPNLVYNLRGNCDVFSVGSEFQTFDYAWGMNFNAPFADALNLQLQKLREDGYFDTLWETWSGFSALCGSSMGVSKTLTVSHLAGIFYFLLIGAMVCIILIVVETFVAACLDPSTGIYKSLWNRMKRRFALKLRDITSDWFECRRDRVTRQSSISHLHIPNGAFAELGDCKLKTTVSTDA